MIKNLVDRFGALKQQGLDKKKMLLMVLVSIAIIFADFNTLLKLQLKGLKSISPQVIRLKKDIRKLKKDLPNLKSKEAEIKEKGHSRLKKFILEKEIPLLLEKISLSANQNNVRLTKILPSRDPKTPNYFFIALDLVCDYHGLGRFLNELENAEDFIAVEEIKIRSTSSDYLQQNVNLLLKTYVKK